MRDTMAVCLGYQVDFIAFVGDFRGARKFFAQDLAGFAGNIDGSLQIIFRHQELKTVRDRNFSIASLSGGYSASVILSSATLCAANFSAYFGPVRYVFRWRTL